LEEATSRLRQIEQRNDDLAHEVDSRESQITHLQQQLLASQNTAHQQANVAVIPVSEASPTNADMDNLRREYDSKLSSRENRIKEVVKDYENQMSTKQRQIQKLTTELHDTQQQYETLQSQHTMLSSTDKQSNERVTTLQHEIEQLQAKLSTSRNEVSIELSQLRDECEALRNRKYRFEKLNSTQPQSSGQEMKLLNDKLEFYERELEQSDLTLSQARTAWNSTADVLQHELKIAERELAEAKKRYTDMQQSQQQQQTTTSLQRKSDTIVQQLNDTITRLENELVQSRIKQAQNQDEILDNEMEIQELQKKLRTSKEGMSERKDHAETVLSPSAAVHTNPTPTSKRSLISNVQRTFQRSSKPSSTHGTPQESVDLQ